MIVPRLLLISPGAGDLDGWLDLALRVPGAAVLLREPHLGEPELRRAAERASASRTVILHARNPAADVVAAALGLAVHGPGRQGVSCHDAAEVDAAFAAGAGYALLSPVWKPTSKPGDRRPPLGFERFLAIAGARPVLALGGVTPARHAALLAAGAWGSAVLGGVAAFAAQNTQISSS